MSHVVRVRSHGQFISSAVAEGREAKSVPGMIVTGLAEKAACSLARLGRSSGYWWSDFDVWGSRLGTGRLLNRSPAMNWQVDVAGLTTHSTSALRELVACGAILQFS